MQAVEDLDRAPAAMERLDEGLQDRGGSLVSPEVVPGFQEMGLGKMPAAEGAGFIRVAAEVDGETARG